MSVSPSLTPAELDQRRRASLASAKKAQEKAELKALVTPRPYFRIPDTVCLFQNNRGEWLITDCKGVGIPATPFEVRLWQMLQEALAR